MNTHCDSTAPEQIHVIFPNTTPPWVYVANIDVARSKFAQVPVYVTIDSAAADHTALGKPDALTAWGTELPTAKSLHRDCHPDDSVFVTWLDAQSNHYVTENTTAARSCRIGYELGRLVERRAQGNELARLQMLETVNREESHARDAAVTEFVADIELIFSGQEDADNGIPNDAMRAMQAVETFRAAFRQGAADER